MEVENDSMYNVKMHENKMMQQGKKAEKMKNKKPLINLWEVNTFLHPTDLNQNYDVMDKNRLLRDLPTILEDIELARAHS